MTARKLVLIVWVSGQRMLVCYVRRAFRALDYCKLYVHNCYEKDHEKITANRRKKTAENALFQYIFCVV